MIGALLLGLLTPAPLAHRRLGLDRRSAALWSRSRRCRAAWAPHLAQARAACLAALDGLPRRRKALVLGSGLLDDVPLAELAEAFEEVVLADAVHPWPARLAVRRFADVSLVTADLSGAGDLVLGRSDRLSDPLAPWRCDERLDFVLSANLLSQLPYAPVEAAERRNFPGSEDLGQRIVKAHLSALASLPARVCLVTDLEQVAFDRQGREVERLDLLHGVALPDPDQAWEWELAPLGEVGRDRRLVHRVGVCLNLCSALRARPR